MNISEVVNSVEGTPVYNLSGRVLFFRSLGNISFIKLGNIQSQIQVILSKNLTKNYKEIVQSLKIGTIVNVSGQTGYSSTREYSVMAKELNILRQPLISFPDKWNGVEDEGIKRSQRYLDCIYNEQTRKTFLDRSTMIQTIRNFLIGEQFLEVETPILTPQASGALAKPFITHRNATNEDFYLRIAPETYLKRMMVAGFDRVFEIGKNFRNEGVSSQHLQEFSVVEWYAAYKNYYYNIGLTAQLLYHLGINEVAEIYSYDDLFVKYTGFTAVSFPDPDTEYKKKIRPYLQNLTLIYDYPASMMPLAHCRGNIAEAFQFVWKGSEIVKGYTEQTDYNAQLEAFRNQGSSLDGEMVIEEDFLEAMKYGMPPMSGVGIGIDRIVMLKHNLSSIKDAVFFSL